MTLRSRFSGAIRGAMRRAGREVVPFDVLHFSELFRQKLMESRGISLVLDVGGNLGQTGEELRAGGYTGRIVSFEPLSAVFAELARVAAADGNWTAHNLAMGETPGTAEINVSGTAASSSLLPMAQRHVSMVPASAYSGVETVKVETVDNLFQTTVKPAERVMLKIDTQGFELAVLRGAKRSLPRIEIVQVELSMVGLYEGQPKYYEVMRHLDEAGFDLANTIPHFFEQSSSQFLQSDAVFVRRSNQAS
jgi:FkbM family methyltransferase